MFADFLKRLAGGSEAPDRDFDYRLAFAALMLRLSHVDGQFDGREDRTIRAVLRSRYRMSEAELESLLAEADALEQDAGDTVHLTKAIKDGVPYEERSAIVEALWRVALADADRDYAENAFLRLVAKLLGVNDVDSGLARQRATRDL